MVLWQGLDVSLSSEDKEDDKEEEANNNKVNDQEQEQEEESEKAEEPDWSNLSVSIEASVGEESVLQEPDNQDEDGTDGSGQLEQQAEGRQEGEVGLPML